MRSLLTARVRWSSSQALPRPKGDSEARGGWYHRPLGLVGLAGLMSGPLRRSGIAAGMPPRGTRTAFPECRPFPAPLQPPSSCLRGTSKRGLNHQDTKKQRNSGWEPDGFPAFLVSSCLCGKSKRCGLNLPVATPLRWTVAEDGPCRAMRRRRCRTRFIQHSKLGRAAAPPCLRASVRDLFSSLESRRARRSRPTGGESPAGLDVRQLALVLLRRHDFLLASGWGGRSQPKVVPPHAGAPFSPRIRPTNWTSPRP